jgi:hypothetical protein
MKLLPLAAAVVANLATVTSAVQAQIFESSSCWEMTSSQPFSGGKSANGFKWRMLGGCNVTVQLGGASFSTLDCRDEANDPSHELHLA